MVDFLHKRVRIIEKNGWKYHGTIIEETEQFYTIHDDKTQREVRINKETVSILEVLE